MADYKSIMSYAEEYNMPLDTALNVDWWQKLADKAYEKGYEQGLENAKIELPSELYVDGFNDGFQQGIKSFAKFLIDKSIDGFEMPDLVKEFLDRKE